MNCPNGYDECQEGCAYPGRCGGKRMSDAELSSRLAYAHDVTLRAVWCAFERKPEPLQAATREVRAEWLAKGLAVPSS